MMRIALFLLTNLAVMVVFGLVLSLTGIQSSSMTGLLIMALLFGFGGSIVSLLMSKWMALKSVGGEVIEQPRNETERWLMNTVAQQARRRALLCRRSLSTMRRILTPLRPARAAMRRWWRSAPGCCRT
jgi:heat shock protein HtpX